MDVTIKGINGTSKDIESNERGRTYYMGTIKAGVTLTDTGLILMITDRFLAKEILKVIESNNKRKEILQLDRKKKKLEKEMRRR